MVTKTLWAQQNRYNTNFVKVKMSQSLSLKKLINPQIVVFELFALKSDFWVVWIDTIKFFHLWTSVFLCRFWNLSMNNALLHLKRMQQLICFDFNVEIKSSERHFAWHRFIKTVFVLRKLQKVSYSLELICLFPFFFFKWLNKPILILFYIFHGIKQGLAELIISVLGIEILISYRLDKLSKLCG